MVRTRSVISPDPAMTRAYERDVYPAYRALYGALKSVREAR